MSRNKVWVWGVLVMVGVAAPAMGAEPLQCAVWRQRLLAWRPEAVDPSIAEIETVARGGMRRTCETPSREALPLYTFQYRFGIKGATPYSPLTPTVGQRYLRTWIANSLSTAYINLREAMGVQQIPALLP